MEAITKERESQLIDLDLDVANLFKGNDLEIDTSVIYIRASGFTVEDGDTLILSGSHKQLSSTLFCFMHEDSNFKNVLLESVANYLSTDDNVLELVELMENVDDIRNEIKNK